MRPSFFSKKAEGDAQDEYDDGDDYNSYHFLKRRKAVRIAVPRMTAASAHMMLSVPELTP